MSIGAKPRRPILEFGITEEGEIKERPGSDLGALKWTPLAGQPTGLIKVVLLAARQEFPATSLAGCEN